MTASLAHPREARRLASLHATELLDSGPEARFDAYAAAVCAQLGVPAAAIALVDRHRVWFMARRGLGPAEVPREGACCNRTVVGERPFDVLDATRDPQLAGHPLVAQEGFRAYLGHPLTGPGGEPIGTLCAFDSRPRRALPREIDTLAVLARRVERELLGTTVRRPLAVGAHGLRHATDGGLWTGSLALDLCRRALSEPDPRRRGAMLAVRLRRERSDGPLDEQLAMSVAERLKRATPPSAAVGRLGPDLLFVLTDHRSDAQMDALAEGVLAYLQGWSSTVFVDREHALPDPIRVPWGVEVARIESIQALGPLMAAPNH